MQGRRQIWIAGEKREYRVQGLFFRSFGVENAFCCDERKIQAQLTEKDIFEETKKGDNSTPHPSSLSFSVSVFTTKIKKWVAKCQFPLLIR